MWSLKHSNNNKKIEKTKKAIKAKIAIYASVILAPYFLVFFILTLFSTNDSSTTMFAMQKSEGFVKAFKKAIYVSTETDYNFYEILAAYVIESKDIEKYDKDLMLRIEEHCKNKGSIKDFVKDKSNYDYLVKTYKNSYKDLIGREIDDDKINYYYNWYFPIAYEIIKPIPAPTSIPVNVSYTDDFLDPRNYGAERYHYGTDIMCLEGSPIICVEGGIVETIGWNSAGGWRIGIRSWDGNRFWYYAHMRKVHPYLKTLDKGDIVRGGRLLGYVGSSGYSDALEPNTMPDSETLTNPLAVDKLFPDHLHFGLQVINGKGKEEWVNPYPILEILVNNGVTVVEREDYFEDYAVEEKERIVFATLEKSYGEESE